MSGGGGASQDFTASNILANIVQQQYANYQALYKPEENKLIDYATDPNTIKNAQMKAISNADAGAQATVQGLNKTLGGQGIKPNANQQAAMSRRQGLSKSLSEVNAANTAGQQTYDTITQILQGGQPNVSGLTTNISQTV